MNHPNLQIKYRKWIILTYKFHCILFFNSFAVFTNYCSCTDDLKNKWVKIFFLSEVDGRGWYQWWESGSVVKTNPYPYLWRTFLSVLKISKTYVFFLTRYRQGSVVKTDPSLYFFEYSSEVLKKKTKVLDILNTDKHCYIKIKN